MKTTIRVFFRDETHEDMPEDTPAKGLRPPGDNKPPSTLADVRLFYPTGAFVTVLRGGTWCDGRYESYQQQIDRLTRERGMLCAEMAATEAAIKAAGAPTWHDGDDRPLTSAEQVTAIAARAAPWKRAAKRLWRILRGAEQDIAHLRRGARAMIGALRPGEDNDWKPSSLAADLVVWAEYVAGLSARADAAEKRLADLRAWADEIANGQSDTPEGRRVAGDFRAVVYRIDGKEDT